MFTKKIWLLAVPVAVIALQGCGGGSGPTPPKARPGNTTGSATAGTTTGNTTGSTTAGTTAGNTTAGTTTGSTTAGTTTGTTTAGTTTGSTTAGTTAGTTTGSTTAGTTTGSTTAGTTTGSTTAGTTTGTTTAGTTTGSTTAGTTTGSTTAGTTTGTTTAGTTTAGGTTGSTTGGQTGGNNIGTYNNVAPTNGQNNLDSTPFAPPSNLRAVNNTNISLRQEKIMPPGTPDEARDFGFNLSDSDPGFAAGRSYQLTRGQNNLNGLLYFQTVQSRSSVTGNDIRVWKAVSGTLTIDSVTFNRDIPDRLESVTFRIINARFQPIDLVGASDPADPTLSQGSFTFNFSGNAFRENSNARKFPSR